MSTPHADKWTAFYLSLVVPGAGQLWVGSASCVAWWLGAAVAAGAWSWVAAAWEGGMGMAASRVVFFLALGVVSAEHARRLAEVDGPGRLSKAITTRVTLAPRTQRRIVSRIEALVPASADQVWTRIADLPRFLTIDTFHEQVTLMRPAPAAGVDVVLSHNAFGRRFDRFGRILQWRPGRGYAFSDLSPRGPRYSFPHAFFIELEPVDGAEPPLTRLTITVRGRWSSRWIPVTLGWWWVHAVACDHARLLRKAL